MSDARELLSVDEVCKMLDNYTGGNPVVIELMKSEIRKGNCPQAVRHDLEIEPAIAFKWCGPQKHWSKR